MKKRILHLTSFHPSFDCRIFYKEAKSLAKEYDVFILAIGNNGKVRDMGGAEYDEGLYDGVYLFSYLFSRSKFLNKILKRFSFFKYFVIKKKIEENKINPDIIHFHEPDLFSVVRKLKKIYKCKIIYDAHEMHFVYPLDMGIYPISHIKTYYNILSMKKGFKSLDASISVNPIIRGINVTFNPLIRHETISNASIFRNKKSASKDNDEKIVIVHEGRVSFGRGFKCMCDIFSDEWIRANVKLKIVGETIGREKQYFNDRIKKEPWLKECIIETGWVSYMNLPNHLDGDIGIIFMEIAYNNLLAGPPNKLFNYISFNMPILSFDIPASTDIIKNNDIGIITKRDLKSIINSLKTLINDIDKYKINIQKVQNKISWSFEEQKLFSLYKELLEEN